jgi:selenoprotein W-related protein
VSLAADIAKSFKQQLESITLVPSDGGRFELELDGDLVWSKLETREFPDHAEMIAAVRDRL